MPDVLLETSPNSLSPSMAVTSFIAALSVKSQHLLSAAAQAGCHDSYSSAAPSRHSLHTVVLPT